MRSELQKWDNFRGSGIVEISAFGFSLRKPFVLAKTTEEMRMDVIEGGILGAGGSPLISIYMGRYLAMNSPVMPILDTLELPNKISPETLAILNTSDYILNRYGEEIIREKAIQRDSLSIIFKNDYKVDSIVDSKSGARMEFRYTSQGDLDEIELRAREGISAKLIFDNISYEKSSIVPLPQKESGSINLMELWEEGEALQLLKRLLGN
nr:hypothetical protein [Candidatus Cloacimonadota bacterium]